MRNLVLSIAASAAVLAAAPVVQAQAPSDGRLIFGVEAVGAPPPVQDVQYLFGGQNYCWYAYGWRGPGYYWCGYANRRGLGWGGPMGWHGWRSGGHGDHGDRGGYGDRGDHGGGGSHVSMNHGGQMGGQMGGRPGPGGGHGGQGGGHPEGGHPDGGHGGGGHAEGGHADGGHH